MAGPADRKLRAVAEHRDAAVARVRLDARDSFQVCDIGPVNAHELFGVQLPFDARNGLLLQIIFLFAAQRDVVVLRLNVIQAVDWDDVNLRAVFHHHPLQLLLRRAGGRGKLGGRDRRPGISQPRPDFFERFLQPIGAEGLQQIIDRAGFEGAHGVLIVSGDENNGGRRVDQLQDFEAVELGHLHV